MARVGASRKSKVASAKRNGDLGSKTDGSSRGPEIFIALVGPIGSDMESVEAGIVSLLASTFRYESCSVRLIRLLHDLPGWSKLKELTREDERYAEHMSAGGKFCELVQRRDALAAFALNSIQAQRKKRTQRHDAPSPRTAYILRSLKRPEEVELLRKVYGPALVVISLYEPRAARLDNLSGRIAHSRDRNQADKFRVTAEGLLKRDEEDSDSWGQNIRNTFPLADIFVEVKSTHPSKVMEPVKRFFELLFGYPYSTPTKDEYGMFHAFAASLRSAALGRQVGAAVCRGGEVIALGTNEVPKAFGGTYWEDDKRDESDQRDFVWKRDPSDENKRNLIENLFELLKDEKWLRTDLNKKNVNELMSLFSSRLRETLVMDVIEFNRTVHAEMSALMDAVKRGVSVDGATLYVTTFPCHECTRHIIAAGIARVVYISSYPKSQASDLHKDSIVVDSSGIGTGKIPFEPFVGIAPRIYRELFEMRKRKDNLGNVLEWRPMSAVPSFADSMWEYRECETSEVKIINTILQKKKLLPH